MDAAALIGHLHGQILRLLSDDAHLPFQGLQEASRCRKLRLDSRTRKRLVQLDHAFAWTRHITASGSEKFMSQLRCQLDDPLWVQDPWAAVSTSLGSDSEVCEDKVESSEDAICKDNMKIEKVVPEFFIGDEMPEVAMRE
eukprot:6038373-Karenia_brevis.AAC.1